MRSPFHPADGATGASQAELLDGLAAAAAAPLAGATLDEALAAVARAACLGAGAALAIVRVADSAGGALAARAVWAPSAVLAAELDGSRLPVEELGPEDREVDPAAAAPPVRRAAERVDAEHVRLVPVTRDHAVVGSVELYRAAPFDEPARAVGHLAAAHVAIALELARTPEGPDALEAAGDALAAGSDESELADHVVRLAQAATGAARCVLRRVEDGSTPTLLASCGDERAPGVTVLVPLGEPPVAELELVVEDAGDVESLTPLAARAAVGLRRTRRAALAELELERSETIVEVLGEAIARLSLAHTLDTAVQRISELAGSGQVGIYLREGDRLGAAASRGLAGAHVEVTERLLELALGPHRSRGYLAVADLRADPRLVGLDRALAKTGVGRALVVPLVAGDEVIGVLAVYEPAPRPHAPGEETLPMALSAQLAVAVQNARLHERAKELGAGLERALDSERRSARQLRGLFEISDAFARSLSFEATLEAVARTMVELFELDAAAIRLSHPSSDALELRAIHVADPELRAAAALILGRAGSGDAELLEPFLAQGASSATLPIETPGELLGSLTLLRLDPARPLDEETIEAVRTVTAQAALALDNARLYQQQKDFAETMQRTLLPVDPPAVAGVEVGHVYESSARVDVGGDIYDVLRLEDGRLAVCLGDVSGKGIQAAADMAMAKFAFRALARSQPGPAEFLARVNEVVVEEIAVGKFVTMVYAVLDPATGELACASAGHPPPRLVEAGGAVRSLGTSGLALGVETDQSYEETRGVLAPGASVVLFTDGITECRRSGELYGEARLDAFLHENAGLPPQALVDALLADCREYGGGELDDDCAVVCLRRAGG